MKWCLILWYMKMHRSMLKLAPNASLGIFFFYNSQSIVSKSFDHTCIYKVLTYRLSLSGWSVEGFGAELLAATSRRGCSLSVVSIFYFLGDGSYVSSSPLFLFLSIRSVSIRPSKSPLLCLLQLWDVVRQRCPADLRGKLGLELFFSDFTASVV